MSRSLSYSHAYRTTDTTGLTSWGVEIELVSGLLLRIQAMTVVDREADMAKQYAWRAYPPVGAMMIAAFTCMHRVPRIPQGSDLESSTYSWSHAYCFTLSWEHH